jgi:Rnl2 family RNA ligase
VKFKKHTSTENSYREKYLAILREYGFADVPWVVSEKIDGANFSFITDGKIVAVATRNDLTNGDFYHSQDVINRYTEKVLYLKQIHFADAKQIQIYGELFGPGIQRKVFYGNEKDYMAFEIQADGVVVNADIAAGLLTLVGIPTPPSFGVFESLDAALELPNIFVSRVYDELYPGDSACQYELGENDAEGLVMKPVVPLYLPNGSRVIIKNKHPKFKEKKKKKKTPAEPNPWVDIADQYVTQNRLDAVVSKLGELKPSDFGKVIRLMSEDVIADMVKDEDLPENWRKLEECRLAGKGITRAVSSFLRINLLHTL